MAVHLSVADSGTVKYAADLLSLGNVIAVPTDTVYGLACSALNPKAISRLYEIKGRCEYKPLAICLSNIDDVERWARIDHLPANLLSNVLPGPVTLVLSYTSQLEHLLTANGKVGIRIPDNLFIRSVVDQLGHPIALTSANVSEKPSSIATHEFETLWPQLACVFDQGTIGQSTNRNASTVIDLSYPGFYKLLRLGIAAEKTKLILNSFGLKPK